jgi:hypothetical protein
MPRAVGLTAVVGDLMPGAPAVTTKTTTTTATVRMTADASGMQHL